MSIPYLGDFRHVSSQPYVYCDRMADDVTDGAEANMLVSLTVGATDAGQRSKAEPHRRASGSKNVIIIA